MAKVATSAVCYLLREKNAGGSNRLRTYKGYTTNLQRRIRQHNGEIAGGAKYTRTFRGGATLVAFIRGFPNKQTAMSYEWYSKRRYGRSSLLKKKKRIGNKTCSFHQNMFVFDGSTSYPNALWTFLAPLQHPKFAKMNLSVYLLQKETRDVLVSREIGNHYHKTTCLFTQE